MQVYFEGAILWVGLAFIVFGLMSYGWLVIHVEHSRHFSKIKALFALVLGSLFMGFGLHFMFLGL